MKIVKRNPLNDFTMCLMHVMFDDESQQFHPTYDADDISADKLWLQHVSDCENVRRIKTGDYSVLRLVSDSGMIILFGTESACYEYCEVLNRA